jgi:4-amino-4-deoxy-L-arabinose transferase-like glycosyltransferase
MPRARSVERLGRTDIAAIAVLLLAGIGIPLWLAASAGAIGLPSNDDWVYTQTARGLFETGRISMPGHTTSFVGQLALVLPFLWLSGGEPWAFTAFGLAMSSIGILCTYLLARRYLGVGSAVIVVVLLLAFPGYIRTSANFMTDVPTYALIMLCMLLGTRWREDGIDRVGLAAALAIGLLASSIREFAIAAPLAVLIAAWARSRRTERVSLAVITALFAIGLVGVLAASGSVAGHGTPATVKLAGLVVLGPAFATLAAVLLPATVLHVARRMDRFTREQIIVGAALGCLLVFDPNGPLLGNLWTAFGYTGNNVLLGGRGPVIGATAWGLSRQIAVFAAILAAVAVVSLVVSALARASSRSNPLVEAIRIVRRRDGVLILFLLGYGAELALFSLLGGLFDRYLYPMVPVAAILLLRTAQPIRMGRSQALSHGVFAWLIVSAFLIAANSFAYDAARFREGEAAVELGYDATMVDAGYEWVGIHGVGEPNTVVDPTRLTWWQHLWPSFRPCAVLSNAQLDLEDYELIRENRAAYRQYLLIGPAQPLYLYGAHLDGCPTPHPIESMTLTPRDASSSDWDLP